MACTVLVSTPMRLGQPAPCAYPHLNEGTELEKAVNDFFQPLQEVTTEQVLVIKPHPHLKHWLNKDLTAMRKLKNRASSNRYDRRGRPDHESHEEFRKISKEFATATAIGNTKANHWKAWIELVNRNDLQRVNEHINASPSDHAANASLT